MSSKTNKSKGHSRKKMKKMNILRRRNGLIFGLVTPMLSCFVVTMMMTTTSIILVSTTTLIVVKAEDVYADEYVRQVIEEEQEHYGYDDPYYRYDEYHAADSSTKSDDDHGQQEQQQQDDTMTEEERRRLEGERRAKEEADRIAAERERKFQKELERMNEEQQKVALKQKRKDHRKVESVLKAARKNDLYGVLGMKNWNIKIPSRTMRIPFLNFSIASPGITIKETTTNEIRKQFRTRAKQMHPDKNKDGRAQEAFIALENAAAILQDPTQRSIYDKEMSIQRQESMAANKQLVTGTIRSITQMIGQIIKVTHTILGPFFTSVMIIVALII
jgi:hypothetical protein